MKRSPRARQLTVHKPGELLIFLADALQVSRRRAKALLDERCVFVNQRRVWMARHALKPGDTVEVQALPAPASAAKERSIPLLYQDGRVFIADKPPGLESTGATGLEGRLRAQIGLDTLRAVHRLDADTSGCLILVRDQALFDAMVEVFQSGAIRKTYRALAAAGTSPLPERIARPLDGKEAVTLCRVLHRSPVALHLEVVIETGRTHQIRRHLAEAGHPVLGDRRYLTQRIEAAGLRALPRQMLHACEVRFPHPETGRIVRARAPLPPDFTRALAQLGLKP